MIKEELKEKLTEIGTCEDDVQRRELITSLSDDLMTDYTTFETLNTQIENLNLCVFFSKIFLFLKLCQAPLPPHHTLSV